MTVNHGWACKKCGGKTNQPDRVCTVCKTENTLIKGKIGKKSAKAAGEDKGHRLRMDPKMCRALESALSLELEGRDFYRRCAENTSDQEGKAMFGYLAGEEQTHYNKIEDFFNRQFHMEYCEYIEGKKDASGVFRTDVPGGRLDSTSDALDALNVGIKAEEKSIELYSKLSGEAPDEKTKAFFDRLQEEERKHRNILDNEVEFVTKTGEFHDFKTVTM